MQMNLRKAAELQKEIRRVIASRELMETTIALSVYDKVLPAVEAAQDAYAENIDSLIELEDALREIRLEVQDTNNDSGVSDLLTEIACLERKISLFNVDRFLKSRHAIESTQQFFDDVVSSIKSGSQGFNAPNHKQAVVFLDSEHIDQYNSMIRGWKAKIANLQDEIAEKNICNKITLSDYALKTLRRFELLV